MCNTGALKTMRQFACLMRAVYYTNGSIYFLIVCPFDPGKKTPKEIRRAGLNAKYSVLAKHCIMSRDWCTNGVVWPVILAMYVQECKHIYVSISLAATSQKSKGQVHIMFFLQYVDQTILFQLCCWILVFTISTVMSVY